MKNHHFQKFSKEFQQENLISDIFSLIFDRFINGFLRQTQCATWNTEKLLNNEFLQIKIFEKMQKYGNQWLVLSCDHPLYKISGCRKMYRFAIVCHEQKHLSRTDTDTRCICTADTWLSCCYYYLSEIYVILFRTLYAIAI